MEDQSNHHNSHTLNGCGCVSKEKGSGDHSVMENKEREEGGSTVVAVIVFQVNSNYQRG